MQERVKVSLFNTCSSCLRVEGGLIQA